MNFHIRKVVLWRRNDVGRHEYEFKPGMVNVISGDPQTGRTSFLDIIDYVLGAKECKLPYRFNVATSWVGVEAETDGNCLLLARAVPELGAGASSACYFEMRKPGEEFAGSEFPSANKKVDDVIAKLNEIVCGDVASQTDDDKGTSDGAELRRIGFRDVINFSIVDDSTIVSNEALLRSFSNPQYRKRLVDSFPYVLGIETRELLDKRNEKIVLEKNLEEKTRVRNRVKEVSESWADELRYKLVRAREMHLCPPGLDIPDTRNTDVLLGIAMAVIQQSQEFVQAKLDSKVVDDFTSEAVACQKRVDSLAEESQKVAAEIERLKELNGRVRELEDVADKTHDRLEISKWIREFWDPAQGRFYGWGSNVSREDAEKNLEKVESALKEFESGIGNAGKRQNYDEVFKRELGKQQQILRQLTIRHRKECEKLEALRKAHDSVEGFAATQRDAYRLLGEISSAIDLTAKLSNAEMSLDDLEAMKKRISDIEIDIQHLIADQKDKILRFNHRIAENFKDRLQLLRVEEEIKEANSEFNIKSFAITFTTLTGELRKFANVGGSSNYVGFHIAFICALHELFAAIGTTPTANFAAFDCPTVKSEPSISDNSIETGLSSIVETFKKSLIASGNAWQPILVCESSRQLFQDDSDPLVHPVAHFSDGNGIIPQSWFVGG